MKLNMWMIANRLKNYEIEARIDKNAEPVLNSTLPRSLTLYKIKKRCIAFIFRLYSAFLARRALW